ncbi:restriction endonuclease subunit S [Zoogloea sp.]|uniref:restriction endonuclease subunit S n=1 Tax=Zoogloea sp. TaxID=49181 RepID=UPI0035B47A7B
MSGLPQGWAAISLGVIADFEMGQAPPGSSCNRAGIGTVFVKAGEFGNRLPIIREWTTDPKKYAQKNDVLICVVGATAGKLNLGMDCSIGRSVAAIRPREEVLQRTIYFQLLPQVERLRASTTGSAQGVINKEMLAAIPFWLPPLPEQKRIADKLDSVLARVDACRERLDGIPTLLKRFRQSILAEATSGRLTADWRGGRCAEQAGRRREAATPTSGAGLSPSVPEGWTFERAESVCAKVQSGGTPKEGFSDVGVPFLKVYNLVDQRVAFEYRAQYIAPELHRGSMSKSRVLPGDVLMNIVGPPLGKVAVVPHTHAEWNINQAITLFRPSNRITTEWLYYVLCLGANIAKIVHETKGSAGQVNISLSQCRDFVFPVPPLPEQHEIVRRVETLFAFADRLEARCTAARKQVGQLTPALLAKAFRGELVPQDPNDEPAAELLKRLAASRGDAPRARRGRRSPAPDAA